MLNTDDLKKLNEIYPSRIEVRQMFEDFSQMIIKVVNDRADYILSELRPIQENSQANSLEHEDMRLRLTNIESTPTVAHELRKKS